MHEKIKKLHAELNNLLKHVHSNKMIFSRRIVNEPNS